MKDGARAFALERTGEFEVLLKRLVEHKSITPGGGHDAECRALALDAVKVFLGLGAASAWVEETGGMPVICARFPRPGSTQNVVVYNHQDVVPIQREAEWVRPPFELAIESDEAEGAIYYGRGATDDKGPALTALFGVLAAQRAGVGIDVTFVWELEEEIGSPNFEKGLDKLRAKMPERVDLILCSDTLWLSDDLPTVVETVRGSISFDVALRTAKGDLHSGICGGGARNPLNELCALASTIAKADGSLAVPGLEADALGARTPGRELLEGVRGQFSAEAFRNEFNLVGGARFDDAATLLERTWAAPCCEIVGVRGGYQGSGVATMIPPEASLKFNVRVPCAGLSVDAVETAVRRHVAKTIPDAVVTVFGKTQPFDGRLDDDEKRALSEAFAAGCSCDPAFGGVGGSIGVLQLLRDKLNAKVLLPSLSSPSQGYHGVNEFYSRRRFQDGVVMYVVLLARLHETHTTRLATPGSFALPTPPSIERA